MGLTRRRKGELRGQRCRDDGSWNRTCRRQGIIPSEGMLDPDFEETQQDQADDSVHILDEDTGWMA